jgi:hypothetical protein
MRGLTMRIRRLRVVSWRRGYGVPVWTGVSWLLLAACVAMSVAAAGAWRAQVWRQPNAAFDAEAASVGSSVTTALRRMDDLTVAARTLVGSNPDLTNAELAAWYRSIGARRRYQGALGFGYMELVPAAHLQRYVAQIRADPIPGVAAPARIFNVVPPGPRASYCLIRLGVAGVVNATSSAACETKPVAPVKDSCSPARSTSARSTSSWRACPLGEAGKESEWKPTGAPGNCPRLCNPLETKLPPSHRR